MKPPESAFEPELPPALVNQSRRVGTRSRTSSVQPPEEIPVQQPIVIPEVVEEVDEPSSQVTDLHDVPEVQAVEVEEETHEVIVTPNEVEVEDGGEGEEDVASASEEEEEESTALSKRSPEDSLVIRQRPHSATAPWYLRLLVMTLVLGGLSAIHSFKQESAPIGFCETGKMTNAVLEASRVHWAAIESCNRENRTTLFPPPDPHATESISPPEPSQAPEASGDYDPEAKDVSNVEPCPPPPLLPFLHPDSCTPCPPHASCSPTSMTCDNGYLIRPNPLLFFLPLPSSPSPANSNAQNSYTIPSHSEGMAPSSDTIPQLVSKYVALLLDGLPGLGSVALPPKCVEDPRRKRLIGALGRAVDSILAAERGRRLCAGIGAGKAVGSEAEEARKWGVEVDALKEGLRKKTSVSVPSLSDSRTRSEDHLTLVSDGFQPNLVPNFEEDFNEAIQQLVQWGGVFIGEDPE